MSDANANLVGLVILNHHEIVHIAVFQAQLIGILLQSIGEYFQIELVVRVLFPPSFNFPLRGGNERPVAFFVVLLMGKPAN